MLLNVCKVRLNSDLLAKSLRQILIFGYQKRHSFLGRAGLTMFTDTVCS